VLGREDLQVHVYDLAALGAVAVKVANNVGRLFRHLEELFFVGQLGVGAMTLEKISNFGD